MSGAIGRQVALFAAMSLIWGLTWAAVKFGLTALPPLLLASLRYLLAAALLLGVVRGWRSAFGRDLIGRTLVSALLINTATYGPLFWGMKTVPSGLAGLVNLALVPVLLYALAAATGEERPTWRHGLALGVGALGLVGLFWSRIDGTTGEASAAGIAAIVLATVSYCVGSVVARPLIEPVGPLALTLVHSAIGGSTLLLLSVAFEPLSTAHLSALGQPVVLGSLVFLSLLGTIVAFTIYLVLLREWGTARSGLYAFVSPIVALATGAWLFGETIGPGEVAAAVLLLGAAGVALSGRHDPSD